MSVELTQKTGNALRALLDAKNSPRNPLYY